ncbi:hypothetical protein KKA27_03460 [Patescibacteria group bacterium]|nr:hypothetical protein [Patescibacteria group bacterium]
MTELDRYESLYLINNYTDKIKVDIFPKREGRNVTKSDLYVAKLLSWSRNLLSKVIVIRKQLNIKPEESIFSEIKEDIGLYSYFATLGNGFPDLSRKSREICRYFQLSDIWELSLQTAIFCNKLPVPFSRPAVGVYEPSPSTLNDVENNIFRLGGFLSGMYEREILTHPAIFFTQKVPHQDFVEWVMHNKNLIERLQTDLPIQRKLKIESKTVDLAEKVWEYRNNKHIKSWTEIAERLQKDHDNLPQQESDSFDIEPQTIKNSYERFITYVMNLEPK